MIKKLQQEYIEYGNSLRGAEVYYRESWECYYFSLLGKSFGMMNDILITLKGYPEENIILREQYQDVTPGYYANKIHWNSIVLNTTELTKDQIKDMIHTSYELVYQKLTKKDKAIVDEMRGMD